MQCKSCNHRSTGHLTVSQCFLKSTLLPRRWCKLIYYRIICVCVCQSLLIGFISTLQRLYTRHTSNGRLLLWSPLPKRTLKTTIDHPLEESSALALHGRQYLCKASIPDQRHSIMACCGSGGAEKENENENESS